MVRTKVFVGNLSFKTRETGLVSAFEAAGKVVNAQIVTRGNNRSLGYGFVEFENEESANKAIKDLNHHTLDEREINVELAKPRPEGAQQPQRPRYNNNRGYNPRYNNQGYRPYNTRGYPPRGQRYNNRPPFRGGSRGGRGGRNPLPKRNIEDRQPSATSLFVTNLPFKFTDVEFAAIFTEAGIKPKSAKVATRYNGRSRGYGFVEFENNADQQKALSNLDKKSVEGRELVLKIAMFAPPQQSSNQGQGQGAPQQSPKPTQSTTQGTQQTTQSPKQPAQSTQGTQQPAPTAAKQPAQPSPQTTKPSQSTQSPNTAKKDNTKK